MDVGVDIDVGIDMDVYVGVDVDVDMDVYVDVDISTGAQWAPLQGRGERRVTTVLRKK